ncbi:hypothetical protein ACSBR1_040600 [Camellia fascicularis]
MAPQSSDWLNIDDFEADDDVRPDFPCPYCYEDFDFASLCSHLEDDHSCESKTSVLEKYVENWISIVAPFQDK